MREEVYPLFFAKEPEFGNSGNLQLPEMVVNGATVPARSIKYERRRQTWVNCNA
jgi:hypothetical protein